MKYIMIAEDDEGIREAFEFVFNREYYTVEVYSSAETLLAALIHIPDVFIIDMLLPGMEGPELCKLLKAKPETNQVPFILMSASPHVYQIAKLVGADNAIEKPFKISAMQELIDRYIMVE